MNFHRLVIPHVVILVFMSSNWEGIEGEEEEKEEGKEIME